MPVLIYGFGLPVPTAIAAALWSFLWSGIIAVALYARRGSIPWRPALWLCLAASPAAYLGARAVALVPGRALEALIAAMLVLAGIDVLRRRHRTAATRPLGGATLAALGGVTGFVAALTGAGGALILVPLLVALGEPVLLAIGLGQVIQLPIAAVATLANIWQGGIDLLLGSVLAAGAEPRHRARRAARARAAASGAAPRPRAHHAGGRCGDRRASRAQRGMSTQ